MIKWAPLIFVRFTFFLICGILFHIHTDIDFSRAPWFLAAPALLYVLLYVVFRKTTSVAARSLLGLAAMLCTFLFGIALTQLRTEKFDQNHLLHTEAEATHYRGKISSFVTQKPNSYKAEIELSHILADGKWLPGEAKIMATIAKDSASAILRYGDVLVIKGQPQEVNPPANPKEFDYREFLSYKGIYHQQYLRSGGYAVMERKAGNSFLTLAFSIRNHFDDVLRRYIPGRQEYALAKALVLGITDELDNALRSAYSAAGVMHVLAVSGLHVGIIYAVLELFLRQLGKGRKGKNTAAIISLSFIWIYAFVTGFSPSVLRAVVMFSFFSIGKLLDRQHASYNVLAISAFGLLCYDPYLIKSVGFQLSYLAVLGIVYLQPRLQNLLEPESRIWQWVWTLSTVSIAAQLATTPLSLYHFHQLPVYFLFTNLLIIPLSTIVLYSGLLVLLASLVPVLAVWAGLATNGLIWFMNQIIFYFRQLPAGFASGLDINAEEVVLLYLMLVLLMAFFEARKLKYFVAATACVLVFSVLQIQETYAQNNTARFAVYNSRKQSAIDFTSHKNTVFVADTSLLHHPQNLDYFIRPNWWSQDVKTPTLQALENDTSAHKTIAVLPDGNKIIARHGKLALLIWQPLRVKFREAVIVDYLLLQKNSRNTLTDLQTKVNFRKLILDSSNSLRYINTKKSEAADLGINVHVVPEQGAFVEYFPTDK